MTTSFGRRSWFALATLILIPGCLEFKKQTLILKFDDKSDKITILSVCEGFYVGGGRLDKKEALKDAKDSLAEFVGEEPAFRYLAGWISLSVKPMPDDSAEVVANKRRIAPIVEIGRGKLFLNEDGRLSGTQTVTIKDRKAFEKSLNELFSQQVANTKSTPEVSAESLDLMSKAAAEGHKWVTITPGRCLIDLPMTGEDADKVLAKVMGEKENAVALAAMRKAFGSMELAKTDRGLTMTIGEGKSQIMTIVFEDKEKIARMEAELLEFAETPPMSIDRSLDSKTLIEKFRSSP